MTPSASIQSNPYKGTQPRCWVRLRFAAADGTLHERELVADTGSPFFIILGLADLGLLSRGHTAGLGTNFGFMFGALVELSMPELGLTTQVQGYGSEDVLGAVQQDSPDFAGIAGLPLLRMLEYGGDATSFWVRKAAGTP
jgi:hypothetical protein